MNYRHAFHAGNFADLIKHGAITLIVDRLVALPEPLLVVDSHAGAGVYDLGGEMALKSGEAEAGVLRLMADELAPEAFRPLKAAVLNANRDGVIRVYPGSPVLIADRLRRDDEYIGAELRPDDFAILNTALGRSHGYARGVQNDGFNLVKLRAPDSRRLFVLIDPPFEQPDDYARMLDALGPVLRRPRPATVLIWLPLKDLETYDSFLRGLEALEPPAALAVEARLQPLTDPMKLNGCALVILNPPPGLEAPLTAIAEWVVRAAGGLGGRAKLWRLNS
ncbi:MAG: 23S rRNA (adenine(2030)-N(6))-methyltransferase RlmJ [Caulobacteraceae bacterium]